MKNLDHFAIRVMKNSLNLFGKLTRRITGGVLPTKLPDIERVWMTNPSHAPPMLAPTACSKMLKSKGV